MSLARGARLGAYEVTDLIGIGGMGEVYRARDTQLNRDVAVKILPEGVVSDTDRVARFQREAQVLASLNHPNIAQIYGLQDTETGKALILEHVDGPTLADVIAKGPISLEDALPMARQIAEALDAAHEHGIIHRDLKPANIKLTKDGAVKVLDFGLAKALDGSDVGRNFLGSPKPRGEGGSSAGSERQDPASALSVSPTITSPAMTMGNVILGTAAYMSPEQAKGNPVDRRSDLWAFGCVLFEMLTGRRAFAGEDVSDTLAEVLKSEPNWSLLPKEMPPPISRLLRRCLVKERKSRMPDAGVAALEIAEAMASPVGEISQSKPAIAKLTHTHYLGRAFAALALLSAGILGTVMYQQLRNVPAPVYRLAILPPPNVRVGLAAGFGAAARSPVTLSLSPDAQHVAFQGISNDGRASLWLQRLDSLTARSLSGTDGATGPFWSPDSRSVGFFADGKLKKIDLSGGSPLTLCDAPPNSKGTWNSAGDILFGSLTPGGGIRRVPSTGGVPADVTQPNRERNERHGHPTFLPDGRRFLYLVATGDGGGETLVAGGVFAASLDSMESKRVLEPGSNVEYNSGRLLFLRETHLMAQTFDLNRMELTGTPTPIAQDVVVGTFMKFVGSFSSSPMGAIAYQRSEDEETTRLRWVDRAGKPIGEVATSGNYRDPEISPDGQRIAVSVVDPVRQAGDIWIYASRDNTPARLTFDAGNARSPRWSPDGNDLFFTAVKKGPRNVFRKNSRGTGADVPITTDMMDKQLADVSPDMKHLLVQSITGGIGARLFVRPISGDGAPTPLGFPNGNEYWGRFSRDGKWILYYSDASGRREVWVARFPLDGSRWQITTTGAWYPRWRGDGREIFYIGFDNALYAVPVNGEGSAFQFGTPQRLFQFNPATPFIPYDVTADGERFILSDLMEGAATVPITVVLNWQEALNHPQEIR